METIKLILATYIGFYSPIYGENGSVIPDYEWIVAAAFVMLFCWFFMKVVLAVIHLLGGSKSKW